MYTVILTLLGLVLLLVFIILAIRIGIKKDVVPQQQGVEESMIHHSGIYSIVRKSPREQMAEFKPSDEEIRKYLADKNVDIEEKPLTTGGREQLLSLWKSQLEKNIALVEKGDQEGVEFYYYTYVWDDPVCRNFIKQGQFVTREQLFRYPHILPPFHLGCGCELRPHHGKEDLRDTTAMGIRPLFTDGKFPMLPEWKIILNAVREGKPT